MPEFLSILLAYLSCDAAAAERVLSHAEAMRCQETYLQLKLAFLPDIDRSGYSALAANERAEASGTAYAAWRAWAAENAQLLAMLRRDAS
jgi:hypothetical protein